MKIVFYGERILMTLWVGALWSVGYVLVPFLFHSFEDSQLVGAVAGQLFAGVSAIGVVCGLLLLAGALTRGSAAQSTLKSPRVWIISLMMLLVLGEFLLEPMISVLRETGLREGSEEAARFAVLHTVSSVIYFLTSVLGLLLIVLGHRSSFREAG